MVLNKLFDWQQYVNNYSDLSSLTSRDAAYKHYLRFGIHENRTDAIYYHSVFYKNGNIIVIQPIYKTFDAYFKLFDQSGHEIKLTDQIIKDQWEPIIISFFKLGKVDKPIELFLKFGPKKMKVNLEIHVPHEKKFLGLTTLFKDDYNILPFFYNYYKKQGVDHFYLYYNGKLTNAIKEICNKPDITLIEWNKIYHSKNAYISPHIAQTGQINDAIYRYGKEQCEYLVICDFDEYLFIKEPVTLKEYIQENPETDVFAFTQILAKSEKRPENMETFPETIFISPTKFEYFTYQQTQIEGNKPSSKCIHKMETLKTTSIHYHDLQDAVVDSTNQMYHFFNWSQPDRKKDTQFFLIDSFTTSNA
jgi:hypothetical protein